jgi:flagellar basal body-associated protein FliL
MQYVGLLFWVEVVRVRTMSAGDVKLDLVHNKPSTEWMDLIRLAAVVVVVVAAAAAAAAVVVDKQANKRVSKTEGQQAREAARQSIDSRARHLC